MNANIRKLKSMPFAQAAIVTDEQGNICLVSYVTPVVSVVDGWLKVNGLYSQTTRKHIGAFMRELGFDYYTAKQLYNDDMKMNIYTGEVVKA